MATEIILPKLGFSMNEGTISEWLVEDGSEVKAGQIIYLLESDKSTTEIEAPVSGIIRVIKPAGEDYEVGTVLGMIE
jgi:pyruvate/2-oxoglutarate dehydrogenase complex dihydrolipoamide acyltransferase (E2) component